MEEKKNEDDNKTIPMKALRTRKRDEMENEHGDGNTSDGNLTKRTNSTNMMNEMESKTPEKKPPTRMRVKKDTEKMNVEYEKRKSRRLIEKDNKSELKGSKGFVGRINNDLFQFLYDEVPLYSVLSERSIEMNHPQIVIHNDTHLRPLNSTRGYCDVQNIECIEVTFLLGVPMSIVRLGGNTKYDFKSINLDVFFTQTDDDSRSQSKRLKEGLQPHNTNDEINHLTVLNLKTNVDHTWLKNANKDVALSEILRIYRNFFDEHLKTQTEHVIKNTEDVGFGEVMGPNQVRAMGSKVTFVHKFGNEQRGDLQTVLPYLSPYMLIAILLRYNDIDRNNRNKSNGLHQMEMFLNRLVMKKSDENELESKRFVEKRYSSRPSNGIEGKKINKKRLYRRSKDQPQVDAQIQCEIQSVEFVQPVQSRENPQIQDSGDSRNPSIQSIASIPSIELDQDVLDERLYNISSDAFNFLQFVANYLRRYLIITAQPHPADQNRIEIDIDGDEFTALRDMIDQNSLDYERLKNAYFEDMISSTSTDLQMMFSPIEKEIKRLVKSLGGLTDTNVLDFINLKI